MAIKNYMTSLIFDNQSVKKINDKIAQEVDPRLYFAAYYNPKRISNDTSAEYDFWVAITNIYSLFTDCAGYVNCNEKGYGGLLGLLNENNLLEKSDKEKVNHFIQLIKDIRSLFCHNMSLEFGKTTEQLESFNNFLKKHLRHEIPTASVPYKLLLSSEDWKTLTSHLASESQNCFNILGDSINKITKFNRKAKVIDKWLNAIAKWYERSPYFQRIIDEYYELTKRMDRYPNKKECDSDLKNEWKINAMEYMRKMNEPVFPHIVLDGLCLNQLTQGSH